MNASHIALFDAIFHSGILFITYARVPGSVDRLLPAADFQLHIPSFSIREDAIFFP